MWRTLSAVLIAFFLASGTAGAAATIDDQAALAGVEEARGVFQIDFDDPAKTALPCIWN